MTPKNEDVEEIEKEKAAWIKTDALSCSMLLHYIDPHILSMYKAYRTCAGIWNEVKLLYTNDIQKLYYVVSTLMNLKQGMEMSDFLGRMTSLKTEFDLFMPIYKTIFEDLAQQDKFFIVLTLVAISPDLTSVRDQILAWLLHVSSPDVVGNSFGFSNYALFVPLGVSNSSSFTSQTQ